MMTYMICMFAANPAAARKQNCARHGLLGIARTEFISASR